MSHVVTQATVPDIWYKTQRVIRSLLAGIVVLVPVLNLSLPLVAAAFDAPGIPARVYLVVNGIIAACLAVLGIVTRLMAIPAINVWLTKFGAGSIPASASRTVNGEQYAPSHSPRGGLRGRVSALRWKAWKTDPSRQKATTPTATKHTD